MFWSDLGPKITFEAIGIIDSSLPTVAIYAKSEEDESDEKAQEKEKKNVNKIAINLATFQITLYQTY